MIAKLIFINQLENNKLSVYLMKQQSPFTRYHRNYLGLNVNSPSSAEPNPQNKISNFESNAYTGGANIYLQSLEESGPFINASSGKKQRKIKVFGIPENRIKKEENIPSLFDAAPQTENEEEKDQMLIDSNLQIGTTSLIEEPSPQIAANQNLYDENQLQKLLYFSGSSASLPPEEPINQPKKAESIKTEEIDLVLQTDVPQKEAEKDYSSVPSRIHFQIKNTESSFVAEEAKARESQNSKIVCQTSFILKSIRGQEKSKDETQKINDNSKILQIPEHSINEQNFTLQLNAISPIPKKYQEIMQASVQYDHPKELMIPKSVKSLKPEVKSSQRPIVPLPKKIQKDERHPDHLNIKNYFESYGSYEQQIEKMINKFEKVSQLKDQEKTIKRELQTLTHKKHQSVGSIHKQTKNKPKSLKAYEPNSSVENIAHPYAFAQSASNFLPSKQLHTEPRNTIDRQLHQDVAKMERIINKFKEISQIISVEVHDGLNQTKYRRDRSEKNLRMANYNNQMMFQSEKLAVQPMDIQSYSWKKINSQPQIHLKIPEKMNPAFDVSQEVESDNYTYKGKMTAEPTSRNGIIPCYSNTIKTEKKPLHSLVQRCESNYNLQMHAEKKCECSHAQLAEEIARLNQKVQKLEKERLARETSPAENSSKKQKAIQDEERSVNQEVSYIQLLPKQKQESFQSIKIKNYKQNPNAYSNLHPVSIIKPPNSMKQSPSGIKTEEAKHSPALTKRKMSKDRPPKPIKNVSRSPQLKKDAIQLKQNHFREEVDLINLKIGFPSIICCLNNNSSESSIIKFGQTIYAKLFSFATGRQGIKGGRLEEKEGFKIKKYQDCIHYYLHNTLNYHLVCYFRGKIYFGQLRDTQSDCKHGFGYYSTPKYIYEGDFVYDKKQGKGTINYSGGDIYYGGWRNGKKEGEGIAVNAAGDVCKGTFQGGKLNGKGEERLKNGDFYRGEFKEGKLEGEGIYWWSDGSVYQGGFKGGLLHGRGVWRSKENDCYEGQYRQNKKHGKGIYKWSNGMIFTGVFEADEQVSLKKQPLGSPDRKSKSGQRNIRARQNSAKKQ